MIALVVFTDGRDDLLADTIRSALANLVGPVSRRLIHDDTGDADHRADLAREYGPLGFEIIGGPHRSGFGGAIRRAWQELALGRERYVFHLEDDFTFDRIVNLEAMAHVLDHRPYLVQIALRRQPWNETERAAGGVVELMPDAYTEHRGVEHYPAGDVLAWLEHRLFFTTNPSLYRAELCTRRWPSGSRSEGRFTLSVLKDPRARFAYWGARDSGEAVTHNGTTRAGVGY